MEETELRWVILAKHPTDGTTFFARRGCWGNWSDDELKVRTFRTKQEALSARRAMRMLQDGSKVIRVEVTIKESGPRKRGHDAGNWTKGACG